MSRLFEEDLNRAHIRYNVHEILRVTNILVTLISTRRFCHEMMRIPEDQEITNILEFVSQYRFCVNQHMPNFNLTHSEGLIVHFILGVIVTRVRLAPEYLYISWAWNSSDDSDSDDPGRGGNNVHLVPNGIRL